MGNGGTMLDMTYLRRDPRRDTPRDYHPNDPARPHDDEPPAQPELRRTDPLGAFAPRPTSTPHRTRR